MPLIEGAKPGSKGFGENIAAEIRAGKEKDQAVAIAYKEAGEKNDAETLLDAVDGCRGTVEAARAKADASRAYPSYTTSELKAWLNDPKVPEETKAKARAEIAARESGASKPKVTPQVDWKDLKR